MKRNGFLKIIAALSFGAVGFPLMLCCDVNTYGDFSVIRLLIYYAVFIACAFVGYAVSELTKNRKKPFRIAARLFGLMLFFIGFASQAFGGDFVTVIASGLNSVFWYFIGGRVNRKTFPEIFPLYGLGFYIVLTFFCHIFATAVIDPDYSKLVADIILVSFVIELCMSALLINQSGIFDRANRRKETKSALPKGLMGYNAAMVLGVVVTFSLIFLFADKLAWCLEQLMLLILKVVVALASLFNAEHMDVETGNGNLGDGLGVDSGAGAPIYELIGVIVLIVLIIVFRKQILSVIKRFFDWLGSLLVGTTEEVDNNEFIDSFEDIVRTKSDTYQGVNLSSLIRQYKAEKSLTSKFRIGYSILLRRINLRRNNIISSSDTTFQQVEKAKDIYPYDELTEIAHNYDALRYNDKEISEEQLDGLDGFIRRENLI